LSLSEEERKAYKHHIGDARISKSTLDSSYSDGKREGLAERKAEGKAEMIRNLHELGLLIEQLTQAFQLSVEEVSNFLKSSV